MKTSASRTNHRKNITLLTRKPELYTPYSQQMKDRGILLISNSYPITFTRCIKVFCGATTLIRQTAKAYNGHGMMSLPNS